MQVNKNAMFSSYNTMHVQDYDCLENVVVLTDSDINNTLCIDVYVTIMYHRCLEW